MKRFLDFRSRRWGYDGWAVRVKGAEQPLYFTVCTTRGEARDLRAGMLDWSARGLEVVKVKIDVEVVE